MGFNPVTWNTSEPSPTQTISNGQTTILNNFSFLQNANGNVMPGFVQFPSGLIMQWGRATSYSDGSNPFTFAGASSSTALGMKAFPNNCFCVFFTVIDNVTTKTPGNVRDGTLTKTGFTMDVTLGQGTIKGMYVFAIGN